MSHSVTLTFTPAESGVTEIKSYTIMRNQDGGAYAQLAFCPVIRDFLGGIASIQGCTTAVPPAGADKQFFEDAPVSYVDNTVLIGHTYCYYVSADPQGNRLSNASGPPSPPSNIVCVTVSAIATAVVLSGQVINNASIQLDWTASTIEASTIATYHLFRSVDGGAFAPLIDLAGNLLTYTDNAVAVNHSYGYYVVASPVVGTDSPPSNQVVLALSIFYTSRIYPIQVIESIRPAMVPLHVSSYMETESISTALSFLSGTLSSGLRSYTNGLPESIKTAMTIQSGTLVNGLDTYSNWPAESFKTSLQVLSGTLVKGLDTYSNWPPEAIKTSLAFLSGTLA